MDSHKTSNTNTLAHRLGVVGAFVLMIIFNYLSTGTKVLNNTNNAIIAKQNPTTLSPDGLTFAIWGLIYLFETFLVIYQLLPSTSDTPVLGGTTRLWIMAAFVFNAIWLPIFSYHRWFLSFAVICCYLFSLYKTSVAMQVNYGDRKIASHTQFFAMTGISLNMAWVVVATLLNFTIVSRNSNIITTVVVEGVKNTTAGAVAPYDFATIGGNVDWAILCIVVASGIAIYRAFKFADLAYCFVTAWALGGIYRMQKFATDENFPIAGKSNDEATWAITFSLLVGAAGAFAIGNIIYRACTTTSITSNNKDPLRKSLSGSLETPSNLV